MVVTAAGLVAIETIQPGDVVLAADEETGEYAYKEVVRTFVNTTEEITHVTISDGEGVQEVIDSTPQHPFYVEGKGWVEASALHAGMTIWFANGTKGTVEDISNEGLEEPVTVYNFEVADFHTYFVGECGVLVHNLCDTDGVNPVNSTTGDTESNNQQNRIPDNDSTTGHIFRDAEGHIPDTPDNRALLEGVANDPANLRGTDKYGNDWYVKDLDSGGQVWVETRNGNIFEGGVNDTPKPWNPGTGLKQP